jgi:hypothetical protein
MIKSYGLFLIGFYHYIFKFMTSTSGCKYSLCTPDDGCRRHPKHVEWLGSKIHKACLELHVVGLLNTFRYFLNTVPSSCDTYIHQAQEKIKKNCEKWSRHRKRFSTIGMLVSANFHLGARLWLLDHRNGTLPTNLTWALPLLNTKFNINPSSNSFRNETLNRRTQYPHCFTYILCSGDAKRQAQATSIPRVGCKLSLQ